VWAAAEGSASGRVRGAEWVPGTTVEPAPSRTVQGAASSHQDCCDKSPPHYTDPARRAGLEGEVLLEMVVTAEGTVTDVRVLQRLGSGLDERAIAAVQQWQFSPARRHGVPVAVLVEVAVEFRLR
jgi:TonB family protein